MATSVNLVSCGDSIKTWDTSGSKLELNHMFTHHSSHVNCVRWNHNSIFMKCFTLRVCARVCLAFDECIAADVVIGSAGEDGSIVLNRHSGEVLGSLPGSKGGSSVSVLRRSVVPRTGIFQ